MRTLEPYQQSDYQVYPGVTAQAFGEWFLTHNPAKLESLCMHDGIDFDALPALVDAVLTEWEFKEERHRDQDTALRHMLNHIRIKKTYAERNNQRRPGQTAPGLPESRADRLKAVAGEILYRLGPGQT